MKKHLLTLQLVTFLAYGAIAQCTPDASATDPGFYPEILEDFCLNQPYDDTLTIVFPLDTTITVPGFGTFTIPVDSAKILDILNLPTDMTWECQNNRCVSFPVSSTIPPIGCVSFGGTPTSVPTNDTIDISVEYWGTFLGNPQSFARVERVVSISETTNCSPTVGIDNLTEGTGINTYPNPSNGAVNWNSVNARSAEVLDNTGRSVLTVAQPNGSMDISPLPKGIYILRLFAEEGAYISRVVKQ